MHTQKTHGNTLNKTIGVKKSHQLLFYTFQFDYKDII